VWLTPPSLPRIRRLYLRLHLCLHLRLRLRRRQLRALELKEAMEVLLLMEVLEVENREADVVGSVAQEEAGEGVTEEEVDEDVESRINLYKFGREGT
jgi:hypothetical protein